MKEYVLSTNEFLNPDVIEGSDAYALLLLRLFLLEPGTNPSHPAMGIGLRRYRYITEVEMSKLQTIVQEQINTYMPSDFLSNTKAYLEMNPHNYLMITIVSDETKYVLDTENSNVPIQLTELIS